MEQERAQEMEQDKDYKVTHEFFIAGVRFHELNTVINDIAEGDILILKPEPSNKFDPNAVRILYSATGIHYAMLGYIPKKHSSEVCAMFEVGKELECILTKLNKDAKPWEKVKVEVREML